MCGATQGQSLVETRVRSISGYASSDPACRGTGSIVHASHDDDGSGSALCPREFPAADATSNAMSSAAIARWWRAGLDIVHAPRQIDGYLYSHRGIFFDFDSWDAQGGPTLLIEHGKRALEVVREQ